MFIGLLTARLRRSVFRPARVACEAGQPCNSRPGRRRYGFAPPSDAVARVPPRPIVSTADESGAFDLVRASRHAGESDPSDGAIFLPPAVPGAAPGSPAPAWDDAYRRFIDKVIATAARAEFAPSLGPGDARLRGLRQ